MDFTLIREFIVEVDENAIICSLAPSSDIMRKPLPEVDSLKQMSARNIHCLFVMLVGEKQGFLQFWDGTVLLLIQALCHMLLLIQWAYIFCVLYEIWINVTRNLLVHAHKKINITNPNSFFNVHKCVQMQCCKTVSKISSPIPSIVFSIVMRF